MASEEQIQKRRMNNKKRNVGLRKTYTTERKAVIKAAVSGEWREPLQMLIINMSHDGEYIGANMKKGILQLRRTSTIMNRRKH